jgi:N-acetylglucosaminyldiphosphoundecaprenol N-acetyl-beta-D-mannosaminyltransferase
MLGVPFDNVTTTETLARIEAMIASRRPHYAATANVDFVVQALEDLELHRILLDAHLVLADGMPLVWASRWLGNPLPERVTGADLVPRLMAEAETKGWRVFFLGGTESSVASAAARVRERHPNLQLVGAYSPPFNPLLEMNDEDILQRIRTARPDILLVAFGCPKQEKWINMHFRAAGVPFSVGVGASIDFLAGTVSRAPRWMQRCGLEWVFRLLQEPGRLFRRYSKDLRWFGSAMLRQTWWLGARSRRSGQPTTVSWLPSSEPAFRLLEVSPRLEVASVCAHRSVWAEAGSGGKHLVVKLDGLEFIDSTGLGLLARLQKDLRAGGKRVLLLAPSPAVRRGVDLMRLGEMLATATTIEEARQVLAQSDAEQEVVLQPAHADAGPLVWQGELVAANADEVRLATEKHLLAQVGRATEVVINLKALRFIDSSGVAVMVRARKLGASHGMKVSFAEPTAAVRQVIRMLRLESSLLGEAR